MAFQTINWSVGITPTGEVFMSFSDGQNTDTYAIPPEAALKLSGAMVDAATRAGKAKAN